jgi:uncharacterized RmlC-like cupin family protein
MLDPARGGSPWRFHIPAGVPHLPYNPSETVPYVGLIARTDPNEQESVILLPELDAVHEPLQGTKPL